MTEEEQTQIEEAPAEAPKKEAEEESKTEENTICKSVGA